MTDKLYHPSKLFIEKRALKHPITNRIMERLPHLEPVIITDVGEFILAEKNNFTDIPPQEKPLILAFQKGEFLKKCPGTQKYICCGYQILNLVNNCEINCSYCILQGYLNSPFIIVYVNLEHLFRELENTFAENPDRIYRIGTGELADSLSTDHLTNFSRELVRFFNHRTKTVLELKTKTTQIENFLDEPHRGRTVVAWSLNTPRAIASEEKTAPSLEERIGAAEKCQKAGFRLAFHFDPMIYYENCEGDYKAVVRKLFEKIDPKNIIWISLGALRYPPHLEGMIRKNHPESMITYGELFPGLDGKFRYFKPIRIRMFREIYREIKKAAPDVFVYLCMESSEVWEKSFGWTPKTSAGLKRMMDELV
ncbi:MAG: DNA photolyase [Calditrichaeota bacterium]|nr:DNA photolyase [Calditrichota bacterium]